LLCDAALLNTCVLYYFICAGGCWTEAFDDADGKVKGVMIHQEIRGMNCTYGVACRNNVGTLNNKI